MKSVVHPHDINRVHWYLRRLSGMSLPEVGHRLRQQVVVELERRKLSPRNDFVENEVDILETWARFQAEQDANFFFREVDRETIIQLHQEGFALERAATLRTASALFQHKICIFGREFDLGLPIAWQRDPLTGRNWPAVYWADIDIRDGETVGGVKWVWELNRHHHLVTLGKAYFLSGEKRYAQEVCVQLRSWIAANPPRIGVNWTSPLELAIRLINWTWALAFIRCSPALTPELFGMILQSVAEQADHISRHLSAYSSANNHLIGEAAGLAITGLFFPWLLNADKWRDKGLEILEREIERQIYPDGVPAEQAIQYLAFVLDFNLLTWRLAELNGLSVPQIWYDRLESACEFICRMMDENGNVPAIGDSDTAWVVRLDDRPEANNYRSILATAAVLLKRPDFKAKAGRWDEKSHWLLGPSGQDTFEALPSEIPETSSRFFEKGGYCVMRAPGCVATFDCGSLGYLALAAHGHADALSLTVSLDGQPVFIDPGTYAYQEGGERRDYFRSTAAHNTVVVDGEDQSEMLGAFLWGRKAEARLLRWETTEDYDVAIAEHNGYETLGITHQRMVLFHKPDWFIVVDRLKGQGDHSFEQLWHVPAECQVSIGQDSLVQKYIHLNMGHKQIILIPLETPSAVQPRIQIGEERPMQGWVSPRYGELSPAPVANFSGRAQLPVQLVTALHLASVSEDIELSNLKAEALKIWNDFEKGVKS